MIYGTLRTWSKDRSFFPTAFTTALAFLDGKNPATLPPGRHDIEGDRIFAMLNDAVTESADMRRFELHRRYIDIQVLLSGLEVQLYAPEPESQAGLLEDDLEAKDIAFYAHPARYNRVNLIPGDYAIYLPGELHCPCCSTGAGETIRKIVFKILQAG